MTCRHVRNAILKNRDVHTGTRISTGTFRTPINAIMAIRKTMVATSKMEMVMLKDKIPMVTRGMDTSPKTT